MLAYPYKGYWSPGRHGQGARPAGGDVPPGRLPVDGLGSGALRSGRRRRSAEVLAAARRRRRSRRDHAAAGRARRAGHCRCSRLGAHPDDIEIAAGGTLLSLGRAAPWPARQVRAADRDAASASRRRGRRRAPSRRAPTSRSNCTTCPTAGCPPSGSRSRRSSRAWRGVLQRRTSSSRRPRVTRTRTTGRSVKLVPTAFRDQLYLAYEIPKWDGDMARPNTYFPLTDEIARRKVELLDKCYPSQRGPRLVGRGDVPRAGPVARHGVPGALRRGVHLLEAGFFVTSSTVPRARSRRPASGKARWSGGAASHQ